MNRIMIQVFISFHRDISFWVSATTNSHRPGSEEYKTQYSKYKSQRILPMSNKKGKVRNVSTVIKKYKFGLIV